MHANYQDLLALRDGQTNDMQAHVDSCAECQAELKSIDGAVEQLFAQYDTKPSDAVWSRIQSSLQVEADSKLASNVVALKPYNMQSLTRSIYALAASIAFVGVISVFMLSGNSQNQQTQLLQASINELMTNSRGLEQSLQQVVIQNQALSVSNQQVAERLYWRLTYVDQLIQEASPENSQQIKVLWNDRIEALNALNKLYFERDNVVAVSEI